MNGPSRLLLLATLYLGIAAPSWAADTGREIPFTQDDRDRIIRLEEGQKHLQQQINDLKVSTQQQFTDLKNFMLWGFSVLLAGMFTLVGFVLWDRRTVVAPVQRRQAEMERDQESLREALRQYARKEPRLAEILKSLNLL